MLHLQGRPQFLPQLLVRVPEPAKRVLNLVQANLLVLRVVQCVDAVFQEVLVHLSEPLADLVYVVRVRRHAQLHPALCQLHGDLWRNERHKVSLLAGGRVHLKYERFEFVGLQHGVDNKLVDAFGIIFVAVQLCDLRVRVPEEIWVRRYLEPPAVNHRQPLRSVHGQKFVSRVVAHPLLFRLVVHVDRTQNAVEVLKMLVYEFQRPAVIEDLPVHLHVLQQSHVMLLSGNASELCVHAVE